MNPPLTLLAARYCSIIAGCFAAALLVACARDAATEQRRPANIILVSIDTLRADRLGVYGYDRPTSPTIDALAARGTRYTRAIAESPWTLPSHATMFTGLHPGEHGAVEPISAVRDSVPMLAEQLRDVGYRTFAYTGGGNVRGSAGFARGFEEYGESKDDFAVTLAAGRKRIEAMDGAAPYFLFLHTYATHCPYAPDREHESALRTWAPEDRLPPQLHCGPRLREWVASRGKPPTPGQMRFLSDMYDAAIRSADARLAEFIAFLDERGAFDDTLLIITSDHGEALRDEKRLGHQSLLNIEVLQVPMILVGRGAPGGVVADTPAGLIDIAPTILDAAGLSPGDLPGRSLLRLGGNKLSPPALAVRFSENNFGDLLRSVVDGDRHLIWHMVDDVWQLFDLTADAEEEHPRPLGDGERELRRSLLLHVEDLIRRRAAARRGGDVGTKAEISEAELERLRALGYLDVERP